ncbi:unnamed protein product [Mycena citricolor]|uniref:Cytochrome b5 heme-binding domain-containing protein n=1 Tax=Mycena citricolor TaxID=2018698 RepID=A0AAD2HD95_9AGAR|nr:unnamed protein product [Mycena citricolor]
MDYVLSSPLLKYSLVLVVPILFLGARHLATSTPTTSPAKSDADDKPAKSIMQAPKDDLLPPKDDPFTLEQLKEFDGSDKAKPIYVAIKGTIFDVTRKVDVYGAGASYNVFAGKDGSKGLGMSSLKPEDAVPDYSGLDAVDRKTLDDWHVFFSKRYNIVGKVVDAQTEEPKL